MPQDRTIHAAIIHLQEGQVDAAERLISPRYEQNPEDPQVAKIYALIMNARGTFREAARVLRRVADHYPDDPSVWINLGTVLRSSKDFDRSLSAYQKAAELGAASADFEFNYGLLMLDRGKFSEAGKRFEQAALLAPDDAQIQLQYVEACFQRGDNALALRSLLRWRQWFGWSPDLLAKSASLLLQLDQVGPAEQLLNKLMQRDDLTADVRLLVCQMLERTNRLEEAQAVFRGVGEEPAQNDPLNSEWLLINGRLHARLGGHDEACASFAKALKRCASFHDRHAYLFPLAKSQDSLGRYEESLRTLTDAHQSQVALIERLSPEHCAPDRPVMAIADLDVDPVDVVRWDREHAPTRQQSPVFLVAFPRSGTTLLEQSIDAHSGLCTTDEQPFLQQAVSALVEKGATYPGRMADLSAVDLEAIRQDYWSKVAGRVKRAPGQRLLDKNPLNMLRLPAICRLWPNADVILATRHPLDVIVSNFFQHYRAPEFGLLCQNLETLATGYTKAFQGWFRQQEALKANVVEMRYENLVSDFPTQIDRLCGFLEIEPEAAMLDPSAHAKEKGYISTPSYSQVVKPISSGAVGRWMRYGEQIRAVVPIIQPVLNRLGYEV